MPGWYLAGKRIIVTQDSNKPDPRISEHVVLDGNETIVHYFGHGSDTRQLEAYLLNNQSDIIHLENVARTGTAVTLTTPEGTAGTYIIKNLTSKKVRDIGRPSKYYVILLNIDLLAQTITTSGI